jgi:hypothetical protein
MKHAKSKMPVEMTHILNEVGITSTDASTVERQVRERAAMQVQDYIEVMYRKISQFHGVEPNASVEDTMRMLQTHTRPRTS